MKGFIIHRFSFLNEIIEGAKKYITCYGYKYISILTSGAINPLNNTTDQNNGEENFYITQPGKEKLLINHEIFNHPLPTDIKRFQLVHRKPISDTPDLEYGFGHYFIVLSDYKVNIPIPKENPYFCLAITIPIDTTNYYWIGKGKADSSYNLLIPYLPPQHNKLIYSYTRESANIAAVMTSYYCTASHTADNDTLVIGEQTLDNQSNIRWRLAIINMNMSSSEYIRLSGVYKE